MASHKSKGFHPLLFVKFFPRSYVLVCYTKNKYSTILVEIEKLMDNLLIFILILSIIHYSIHYIHYVKHYIYDI